MLVTWTLSFPSAGVGLGVAASPAVLAAIRAAYSALLSVPPATILIVNATDIATGIMAPQSALAQGRRLLARRLQLGSAGVALQLAAYLGKAPSLAAAQAMTAALGAPPQAGFFSGVLAAVSAASGVPVARLSANPGPAKLVDPQLAGLSLGAGGAAASSSSGGSTAGAAVGGILAAIALALSVWAWRSHAKQVSK